jgi:hypothetical protein
MCGRGEGGEEEGVKLCHEVVGGVSTFPVQAWTNIE